MRIKVHPALCVGWGECHRWARDVYPLDDEGLNELRLLEVPPEHEAAARLGARACPEGAITIIEHAPVAETADVVVGLPAVAGAAGA